MSSSSIRFHPEGPGGAGLEDWGSIPAESLESGEGVQRGAFSSRTSAWGCRPGCGLHAVHGQGAAARQQRVHAAAGRRGDDRARGRHAGDGARWAGVLPAQGPADALAADGARAQVFRDLRRPGRCGAARHGAGAGRRPGRRAVAVDAARGRDAARARAGAAGQARLRRHDRPVHRRRVGDQPLSPPGHALSALRADARAGGRRVGGRRADRQEYGPGETFFIARGMAGDFQVTTGLRKIYCIFIEKQAA